MTWAVYQAKLAIHIVPEDDVRKHEISKPCWCGARVDYPNTDNVIHRSFDPQYEADEEIDPLNPDPQMTKQ